MLHARMEATARRNAMIASFATAALGGLAVLLAIGAGRDWAHRHILPAWVLTWPTQLEIILGLRLSLGAIGLALILFLRPWLARAFAVGRGRDAMITLALAATGLVASVGATEAILRTRTWRATSEKWGPSEPLRARDPVLGWTLAPNHRGSARHGGRAVRYATDRFGYRVAEHGKGVDLARPSILFAGESVVFGYGLQWSEAFPTQVEARMGLQAVNMAVNSYSTDQTLLRLRREIVRFERPVAVIVPFVPRLFDRDLDRDRPHLSATLHWQPAEPPPLRLVELARRFTRYRSRAAIDEGIRMTQAALRETLALARSRGAAAIILVPQFMPEPEREREVRREVLDAAGLPYLLVPLSAEWRIPDDRHPDSRGASAMADAVAARLRHMVSLARSPPAAVPKDDRR